MFTENLFLKICQSFNEWHEDNYDVARHGTLSWERKTKDQINRLLGRRQRQHGINQRASALKPHLEKLGKLWEDLVDDASKDLLVDLMAYRVLGYRHVKLDTNTPEYWKVLEHWNTKAAEAKDRLPTGFRHFELTSLSLNDIGSEIQAFIRPAAVMSQFFLAQYQHTSGSLSIGVEKGHVVFDCGGCWGETALHFAEQAGAEGRVISFEFVPSNLVIYRKNLALNPGLSKQIEIVEHPLWSEAGGDLHYSDNGPGSRVEPEAFDGATGSVTMCTIDSVMLDKGLDKLSFIKMDIEGAELNALKGAEESLKKYRPKLAISVYHAISDFYEIHAYLKSLDLGYRFYLRHATIHAEETVLFATAD